MEDGEDVKNQQQLFVAKMAEDNYFKKKKKNQKRNKKKSATTLVAKMGEDKFFKKGNYEKSDTLFVQHKTCTHVENKIKAEHPKKFKPLCL